MPGHRLSRLAKGTPSESQLSIGTIALGVKMFPVGCAQDSRRVPYAKNAVLDLTPPTLKIPEFFTIVPIVSTTLTVCRRKRGDPSSLGCITNIRPSLCLGFAANEQLDVTEDYA